jgi:glycosyltransferase involved in cell wall biosynthesis
MRLRILFCTLAYHPVAAGGAERQARLQAEELVRRGHHVTVVCPAVPGVASGMVGDVKVVRLPIVPRRPFRTVSYVAALAGYLVLRIRSFDVVHVHLANLQADVAAVLGAIFHRPVYVKVAAGGELGEVGRFRRLAILTRYVGLRGATRVQAISDEIEQDLLGIGIPPAKIVRTPNGIDLARVGDVTARPDATSRQALDLPVEGVIVLYVGRFAVYKGIDDLLAAWRDLAPQTAHLALAGATLIERVPELRPSDRVSVHPWTSDISAFHRAADVFVLPSHSEGMSNALLEAMAVGLPSIATRVGAAESMIEDGVTGILIDPCDRAALSAALRCLIEDAELRHRLGSAAAGSVRSRYSITTVVDTIERSYRVIVRPR